MELIEYDILNTIEINFDADTRSHLYLTSLYYVITTFTSVGFGDILPDSIYEICAVFILLV